jgi:hypothetical protein
MYIGCQRRHRKIRNIHMGNEKEEEEKCFDLFESTTPAV